MKNDSPNEYLTIKEPKTAKLKEKRSIFIAQVFPVSCEDKTKIQIDMVKKEFFDANHHCFALRIGKGESEFFKYSDAGEPRGTAGKPILTAIQSKNLTDVLVVVTRYFGGIKLGTGGLSRAYHSITLKVLNECDIVKKIKKAQMNLKIPLNLYGNVCKVLGKYNCDISKTDFKENNVEITLEIEGKRSSDLKNNLIEATDGKIEFI
ncbi:MAG: YigZ family protein [Candidatus Zixiibacteriota bacterium]